MEQSQTTFKVYEDGMVYVTIANNVTDGDNFKLFLQTLREYVKSDHPFTLFIDATNLFQIPLKYTRTTAAFLKDNRHLFKLNVLASTILIRSPVIKGLMDIVFSLQKPASPNKIVTDRAKGFEFLESHMFKQFR